MLLHCSHAAAVNQLPEPLQVCYGFVHQLCVSGDGLQPGWPETLGRSRGTDQKASGLQSFTSLPFERSAKLFVGFNEPVDDSVISAAPLDSAPSGRQSEWFNLRISASVKPSTLFLRARGRPRFLGFLSSSLSSVSLSEPDVRCFCLEASLSLSLARA